MRLLSFAFILLVIFASTRALVRALPGDPLETLVAESGTSIPIEQLRTELGLDQSYLPSLVQDLKRMAHGDLGTSLLSRRPVAPVLFSRLKHTLELTALSLLLGLIFSVPLGLYAAAHPGSFSDRFCSFHGTLMAAVPTPWIGAALIVLFSIWVPLFPIGSHIALPALTLALSYSSLWARLIRQRTRETLSHGSAQGARARGISEWKVVLKYGLAPASGSLLAYLGTQIGALLGGVVITETVFDWQGMGLLLVESVLRRDYPTVEMTTFVGAALALSFNFLGDWAQSLLDPQGELK